MCTPAASDWGVLARVNLRGPPGVELTLDVVDCLLGAGVVARGPEMGTNTGIAKQNIILKHKCRSAFHIHYSVF